MRVRQPASRQAPRQAAKPAVRSAVYYAVRLMDDATARRRFAELTAKRTLIGDEADEVQFLADRLGVPLRWTHFDLRTWRWGEGRGGKT